MMSLPDWPMFLLRGHLCFWPMFLQGGLHPGWCLLWTENPLERELPILRPICMVKSGRYASYWNAFFLWCFSLSLLLAVNGPQAIAIVEMTCLQRNCTITLAPGTEYESTLITLNAK